MMALLFLTVSFFSWSQEPLHWSHILKISERHEFYQNNEMLDKPKDAWQLLFALNYVDRGLNKLKDCFFYRVPGTESGVIKIKTLPSSNSCETHLLSPGDKEVPNVKALQFSISVKEVQIDFSLADFTTQKWNAYLQTPLEKPQAKMHLSSAEFRSPEIIFLAAETPVKIKTNGENPASGFLCHNINEDCEEVSPSTCGQCADGWFEIPNGCKQGPKYCGRMQCGGKNQPACRRGIEWQKKNQDFDCRTDSSFAYCSKGLAVSCEGRKAFCR